MNDFIIDDQGTIVLFEPVSQRAKDWWDDSVEQHDWNKLGNSFAVERRMANAIYIGLVEAQFQLEVR